MDHPQRKEARWDQGHHPLPPNCRCDLTARQDGLCSLMVSHVSPSSHKLLVSGYLSQQEKELRQRQSMAVITHSGPRHAGRGCRAGARTWACIFHCRGCLQLWAEGVKAMLPGHEDLSPTP